MEITKLQVASMEIEVIFKADQYWLPLHHVCTLADKGTAADKKRIAYNLDCEGEKINNIIYYPAPELVKNKEIKNTCDILSDLFKSNIIAERLGKDNENLNIQLNNSINNVNSYLELTAQLRKEIEELELKNENNSSNVTELQDEIDDMTSNCKELEVNHKGLQKQFLEVSKQSETDKEYIEHLQNEIQLFSKEKVELYKKLDKLQAMTTTPKTVKALLQRLGSFLISPELGFLTFIFVLLVQVYHNARLFHDSETAKYWAVAIVYAIGVDLFAIILTVHFDKKNTLKYFAFAQFALNILYYRVWLNHADVTPVAIWEALSTTLISALLAFVIYAYGELFVKIIAKHLKNLTV
jgi:hypothetical protein